MMDKDKNSVFFQSSNNSDDQTNKTTANLILELQELKNKMEKKVNYMDNVIVSDQDASLQNQSTQNSYATLSKTEATASDVSSVLSEYNQKIISNMQEKDLLMKETNNLSKVLYTYSKSQDTFNASGTKEYKSVWALRVLVSILVILSSTLSYFLLEPLVYKTSITVAEVLVRSLPMVLVFLLVAYYIAMEKQHVKRANAHRDLSLKLSLLDVYLTDLPKNDADLIKIELAKYFFNSINKTNK